MITFLKAQVASCTASIIDFLITILCVQVFGTWYVLGSILGTITGGVVNFSIGRNWVFDSREAAIKTQAFRYMLVWMGYLTLISFGVFLLTDFLALNYILSKLVMTGAFGIPYNYLLQKKFIFSQSLSEASIEDTEGI